jgi:hypothetical protein
MENGTTNHMIVLQGETVLLPCKAYSLGQRTVRIISHVYSIANLFSTTQKSIDAEMTNGTPFPFVI